MKFPHGNDPRLPVFVECNTTAATVRFQTFNLARAAHGRITPSLLDRFLACMKPASTLNARLVRAFFLFVRACG
jgi:hypothetical protein